MTIHSINPHSKVSIENIANIMSQLVKKISNSILPIYNIILSDQYYLMIDEISQILNDYLKIYRFYDDVGIKNIYVQIYNQTINLVVFVNIKIYPFKYTNEMSIWQKFINNEYMSPNFYEDKSFTEKLHILKYDESERWINGEREIEIKFLKNIKEWLSFYNPIFVTWSEHFYNPTKDFVNLIQVSSNFEEKLGEDRDFHPGPVGCYEVYKIMYNLLDIKEEMQEFKRDLL
jgi:hypothetical protein